MAKATGVEVARISVKVSPDTSKFRRELKRQLDDIEKALGKDPVQTDLDVDTDKAEKKVAKSKEKMGKKPLALDLDDSGFNKTIAAMQKKMGTLDLRWDAKVKDFLRGGTFDKVIAPKLEFAQLRSQSNAIINEYERVRDEAFRSNQKLADSMATTWRDSFNPEVIRDRISRAFGGKGLEIPVTPVDSSGAKGGKGFAALLQGKGGNGLGDNLLPSFGSGINLSGMALILGGILLVATPLIGLITTALMALPGLVSLAAAPIAAITLGLDGFKKAAEKIKEPFERLKNTMSQAAETQFTPVLQRVADEIFPRLERSLPAVTAGLAQFAQGALDAFNRPENALKFEGSIQRIGDAFRDMRPGMDGFTSGLIGLIDQFSLKLPDITAWFNKVGGDFDAWVKKISADGSLSTAFDQLGHFIQRVLDLLGQLATKGFDFMSKPGSLDGFIATFEKLGEVLKGLVDISAKLNENFQKLVQGGRVLGVLSSLMGGDLQGAFNNAKDLINNKSFADGGSIDAVTKLKQEAEAAGAAAEASKGKLQDLMTGVQSAPKGADGNPLQVLQDTLTAPKDPVQVPPPDTAAAEAKVTEYQSFVDQVTAQVRGSLQQATSGESLPAPDFTAFKAAWNALPNIVQSAIGQMNAIAGAAVNEIVATFQTGGNVIVATVQQWPAAIAGALSGLAGIGSAAGGALMQGLLSGMQAGEGAVLAYAGTLAGKIQAKKGPLEYDKTVLQPNGEALMFGLGKGLESGFAPVLDQAKAMAEQISAAFSSGADPTALIQGYSDQDIKRVEKALQLEMKRLEVQAKALEYQAKMSGDESLKNRAKEIRMQKDQLGLQKDMLDLTNEYSDSTGSSSEDPFAKAAGGLMAAPVNFAKATGAQFLQDIGIGGNGFISKALTEGIQYVFNIQSVDEAMSIKDREVSKQAVAAIGRT